MRTPGNSNHHFAFGREFSADERIYFWIFPWVQQTWWIFQSTIWTDLRDFITCNSMKILSVVLVILMGLDVSTLLSNISSFRQVYIPSAVKLSVQSTNSGRYISPWLQPMVTHMLTWLRGVHVACWRSLSKVILKWVILKLEKDGCLIVKEISGFTPLLEATSTWKLFATGGPK